MKKIYKANILGHVMPIAFGGIVFISLFIFLHQFIWAVWFLVFVVIISSTYWFESLSIENNTITRTELVIIKKTISIGDICSTKYQGPSIFPSINLYDKAGKEIFFLGLATYTERTVANVLIDLKQENQNIGLDEYSKKLIEKYTNK